jgi:predicted CopG family antitoxin
MGTKTISITDEAYDVLNLGKKTEIVFLCDFKIR